MKIKISEHSQHLESLFEILPPGCTLDLMRCCGQFEKFQGSKNITLKSANSLKNKKLIKKNSKGNWVPTRKGLELHG